MAQREGAGPFRDGERARVLVDDDFTSSLQPRCIDN